MIEVNRSRIGIERKILRRLEESSLYRKLSHDLHLQMSFRNMDVIPVRVKEEVADKFPGTLFSGPGSKELNWKTVRLGPASTVLQSFIEPPSQVVSSLLIQDLLSIKCIVRTNNFLLCDIPLPFPNIEPDAADCINVGRTSYFVMAEDTRLKENANSSSSSRHFAPESFKYSFQLMCELWRNQRVDIRRIDAKIFSRTNCHFKHFNIFCAQRRRNTGCTKIFP